MPFPTAYQSGHKQLYHWQPLHKERLEATLRGNTIYCSRPGDFNDPWDCRPYFNTDLLQQPDELRKHVDWAVDICTRDGRMSPEDMNRMGQALQDAAVQERYLLQIIDETQQVVLERYRVYCMCPNVQNPLMWAHYADHHRGVCLEFNVRNEVICGALQVQYFREFPMTPAYSKDLADNLLPLVAKSDAWSGESEFRLIAQEADNATKHETLITRGGHLPLPAGALSAVIVGCNADYEAVARLIRETGNKVELKRAHKVPNRYELRVDG